MMAEAILAELRARGVQLMPVAPDRLRIRPASVVPPPLREELVRHKAEVLALLGERPRRRGGCGYAYPWPDTLPGLGSCTVGPFDLCADCSAGSWVRYGKHVLCLRCAHSREVW